jgi:hypothetical protein
LKQAGEGFNQHRECRETSDAASFPQRDYSFNPTVPFFIKASLHHSLPEDSKSQRSFCPVVCGFMAIFKEKEPKMRRSPCEVGLNAAIGVGTVSQHPLSHGARVV